MKKFGIIILLLPLFSICSFAHATSGACSYHDGVDCSAGPAYDGNAVCNDGSESSVSYSDMEECSVSPSQQCPSYPVQPSCSLIDIEQQKKSALGSNTAIQANAGLLGSTFGGAQTSNVGSQYDLEYSECQSEINDYNAEVQSYNQCEANRGNQEQTTASEQPTVSKQETQDMQALCALSGPYAIVKNDGICGCQSGYTMDTVNGKYECVTPNQWCADVFGPGTVSADKGKCICAPNYTVTGHINPLCAPTANVTPLTIPFGSLPVAPIPENNTSIIPGAIPFGSKPLATSTPQGEDNFLNSITVSKSTSSSAIKSTSSIPVTASATIITKSNGSFISKIFGSIISWFGKFF